MTTYKDDIAAARLVPEGIIAALLVTLAGWTSDLCAAEGRAGGVPASDVTSASAGQNAAVPQLHVLVDPRVELFSLLFRLAGNPEYNQAKVESYSADVDRYFDTYRNHAAVTLARRLRNTRGVAYDACMSLAVHVADTDGLELLVPLQPWPEGLDTRWTAESVSNFLRVARDFANESSFHDFVTQHAPLYARTTERLEGLLEQGHLEWFYEYFGERPQATFGVIAGLLNGGCCYGPHCQEATGHEQLYCILGVWRTDEQGFPEFTSDMLGTVVHEFCHSYANAIVDRHQGELNSASRTLYDSVADKMRSQAYGNPQTLLRESLVRASTVRYQQQYHGEEAARMEVDAHKRRGFLWMDELSDLLSEYEAQRDRYPTLESFTPRLVEFFNKYADRFAEEQKSLAAKRPKVVSMIPANGAENVDPGTTDIRVTFDRPMQDGSWSLVGSGPHCPETTGKAHYDPSRTTWSIPVKLKPEWRYEFYLNRGIYDSFRSEDGVPLNPVPVKFTTTKAATR